MANTPEPTADELRERMKHIEIEEANLASSCPDSNTYLNDIRSRHKEPHFMVYEVVEMIHMSVIFTSECYEDAVNAFYQRFNSDKKARIDLVVREVSNGVPLFRHTVNEMSVIDNETSRVSSYSDPYGHFGYSVYNHTYRDTPWAGYEIYTKPTKTFHFIHCEPRGENNE